MTTKLGVYIHIPFCNGKCAYCDFVSGVYPNETQQAYFSMLKREIKQFDFSQYIIDTVYFGGGTPSAVDAANISDVLQLLRKCAAFDKTAEISIECNPESFTAEKAAAYSSCGVNRISFGLQSSNDKLLKTIGRLHNLADFTKAAATARKYFGNISADLMLGLPGQNTGDVTDSIDLICRDVSHISVYALKVEDGTPLAASGYAPDEDLSADLYDHASSLLAKRGFERYEVSNFARNGKICRHNYKYWTLDDYKGFGVAAHSYLCGRREENTSSLTEYLNGSTVLTARKISQDEDMEEFIMLALRTSAGIDLNKFEQRFGFRLEVKKAEEIEKLKQFLNISNNNISIADNGLYIMNKIIVELI